MTHAQDGLRATDEVDVIVVRTIKAEEWARQTFLLPSVLETKGKRNYPDTYSMVSPCYLWEVEYE